jgi:thiol-disulfide isomerase/thioredoxin
MMVFAPKDPRKISAKDFGPEGGLKIAGIALLMAVAEGCSVCDLAMPAVKRLAGEAGGAYETFLADISREPGLKTLIDVRVAPTFIFYKDGKEVDRILGAPGGGADAIYGKLKERLDGLGP